MARADLAAAAGGDVFMPGSAEDHRNILKALESGTLTRDQLRHNASHLIKTSEYLNRGR